MGNEAPNRERQTYEKPKLVVIDLAAEEVLGNGCKTSPGNPTGKLNIGCNNAACSSGTYGS